MAQAQTYEPLTDAELLSVADEPSLQMKLTEDERKRMGRLLLQQKGERNITSGERADHGVLGIDHAALTDLASKLPAALRWSGGTALDAIASLAEFLSAPENIASMGAAPVAAGLDAVAPMAGRALMTSGRGVEAAGRGMRWPARGISAYQLATNPGRAAMTVAAPEATQMAGRAMQRVGSKLIPVVEKAEAPIVAQELPTELPIELTRRLRAEHRAKYAATSPAENAAAETAQTGAPRPAQKSPAPRPSAGEAGAPLPAHPSRSVGQMSPTAIQSDLGIAARRARLKLTEDQYQAAEGLVRQGAEPADAVRQVAGPPKMKLSTEETLFVLNQKIAGKSDAEIQAALQARRGGALGNLPTDAEMKASIAERNRTGRWGPVTGSKLRRAKQEAEKP